LEQSVKNASKTKVSLGEVDEEAKKAKEKENLTSITMNYRIPNFQKIRLVPYLFNFGLYELAFNLIQTFPEYCLVSYLPLRISMFKFIEKNLEKYHEKSLTTITKLITGKNTEKSELDDSMDDESDKDFLFNVVFKAVNALGPYMSEQAILLTKVLRVADFYEDDVQIFNMLQKTMLPSLNLMEGNCGFSNEIWKVLQKYPFQVRFEVYKTWLHEDTWRAHAQCEKTVKTLTIFKKNMPQFVSRPAGPSFGKKRLRSVGIYMWWIAAWRTWQNLLVYQP